MITNWKDVVGVLVGLAVAFGIFTLASAYAEKHKQQIEVTKVHKQEMIRTVHLYDWTGEGKLGDLVICTCSPGRLEPVKAPVPKGP